MKICEYCGTKVPDNTAQCEGCGSKEFKNICTTCGEVLLGSKCPKCESHQKSSTERVVPPPIVPPPIVPPPVRRKTKPKKNKKLIAILALIYFGVVCTFVFNYKADPEGSLLSGLIVETPKEQELSYTEILTLNDHPQFYGDYKAAKKFWKGYKGVKVVNSTSTSFNEDALLLVTSSDYEIIENITINLSGVEDKQNLKLRDVVQFISNYIPYDIIDKYYVFKEAYHEILKDGEYEAYHYVMELNDEGNKAYKSGEKYLNDKFSFKIIHRNDNDWIAEINYLAYSGNYEKYKAGTYDVKKWKVNLKKFRN